MASPSDKLMKRRRIRALEAKRDKLLQTKEGAVKNLAVVRAELKSERKTR